MVVSAADKLPALTDKCSTNTPADVNANPDAAQKDTTKISKLAHADHIAYL